MGAEDFFPSQPWVRDVAGMRIMCVHWQYRVIPLHHGNCLRLHVDATLRWSSMRCARVPILTSGVTIQAGLLLVLLHNVRTVLMLYGGFWKLVRVWIIRAMMAALHYMWQWLGNAKLRVAFSVSMALRGQ